MSDKLLDKEIEVLIHHSEQRLNFVSVKTVQPKLSEELIFNGYAKIDESQPGFPEKFKTWNAIQEKAQEDQAGLWNLDEEDY